MQIVIEIDEKTYKDIQSHDWKNGGRWFSEEWKAIHNGTPLPKGHGRLIDADALNRKDVNCANIPMNFIDTAPTIIEADGGDGE
jgi:hypothetical protein